MNKLIKALVLSFILAGIAVYIIVSAMPGSNPEEKLNVAGSRAAKTGEELEKAIAEKRISDVPSIVRGAYQPPAPGEFGVPAAAEPARDGGAASARTGAAKPEAGASRDSDQVTAAAETVQPKAEPKPEPPAETTHKVKPGETLSMIAKQYLGDSNKWKLIKDANPGMNPDLLKVGQVVRIPIAGAKDAGKAAETGTQSGNRAPKARIHVVAQGDTIYSISRKYSVRADEIRALNPGLEDHSLGVGRKLCIPGSE